MTQPSSEVASEPPREGRGLRLLTFVASLLVATIVALTFAQVVLRYVFNNPQSWVEEVGRYLFVWITFLGAAAAFSRDTHIRVDALVLLMGKRAQRLVDLLRRAADLVAAAVLLYAGVLVAWRNRTVSFYTVPELPQLLFYAAAPVGAALMLFYVLRGLAAWQR